MEVVGAAVLDFGSAAFIADPYPTYAALRRESPVLWHEPSQLWLTFRYADVSAVLRDRRLGRIWRDHEPRDAFEPFNLLHRHALLESEPPDHTRLRRLVQGAFARGHVERLRPRIRAIADELLDRVAGAGRMDLLADYAEPLPVIVIAELLGVPEADRHLLRPWSNAIVKMYEYERAPGVDITAVRAAADFARYLRGMRAERRARPREDLVSSLVEIEDGGERLSEDELVATCVLLLNAGHEASVNVLGNGMTALLHHPDQLARVRADPALVPTAVEELIRFDPPLQLFERTATEDVEVGAHRVPAGAKVGALLGAANRDPEAFAEPDRLDVARTPNPHVGFGAGIHFCVGAPLARVELQVSLDTLLRRLPRLALAAEPELRPTYVLRGRREVQVSF